MPDIIQPRKLKGFRDFLPEQEIPRLLLVERLERAFRGFGFVPIDTPALEYAEVLLRKSNGETEKQVFRFTDAGGRDVALRFDLTVPFARFVAEHKAEICFPFKRYHIAKVWRGEKPQAGRYREFMQCDFDIIGADSSASDFEILYIIKEAFDAIGVRGVTVKVSHRGIFNRVLARLGLSEKKEEILRLADKSAKISAEELAAQMKELAGSEEKASEVIAYTQLGQAGMGFEETLAAMEEAAGGAGSDSARLREIYECMKAAGIEGSFCLDPSITRGLDYYTGIVYETFLDDYPQIGSVCSGGRYDNLAGLYMKEEVSGAGASIGLDRLIAALEHLGLLGGRASFADAVLFCKDGDDAPRLYGLAAKLRALGVSCDVFPESKKIAQQYAYAEKKGAAWGIFASNREGACTLKNLASREAFEEISVERAAEMIRGLGPRLES